MKRIRVFISSVQSEFAKERAMLGEYIRRDALLGKFFETFLFEDVPANEASPQQVYLSEVEMSDIYLGLYGNKYGYEDAEGVSPTEREYDRAAELHKTRLIFIKSIDEDNRHPKESALIKKAERDIVRKTFVDAEGLRTSVYASLVRYLEEKEYIRWQPFDAAFDTNAKLEDLDEDKMHDFIVQARAKRNFPLSENSTPTKLLTHLSLMDEKGRISNSAVLLFGKRPQKFFITSEVKCVQFFGNVVEKPLPAYQICRGTLFDMIDQATAFVMDRVDLAVGTRAEGKTASVPTNYELPPDAVKEAIVNAVAHRDYTSNGSVQVMLFRNRLEVWNPGQLPYGLTVSKLLEPHKSLPANPLIADPLFWTGYVDKVGTGTEDIVNLCKEKGLKEPEYHQEEDFRVVIWRRNPEKGLSEGLSEGPSEGLSRDQVSTKLNQKWEKIEPMIRLLENTSSAADLRSVMGMNNATKFKNNYLNPLIELGVVEMTQPESPNSPTQRYRLTEAGKGLLK
jgi:predicted HTH transcriptional regulator